MPSVPQNAGYYHAAYLAALGIYAAYALTLRVRARRAVERLRAAMTHRAAPPVDTAP
jgi:hypothetical protein